MNSDSNEGYSSGKFYYSFGWSLSNSSGFSLDFTTITSINPNTLFNLQDFEGFGNSISTGFGGAFTRGGSSQLSGFFNTVGSRQWGNYNKGYMTSGVSYGLGKPSLGISFSRTQTKFFKR